MNMPRECNTLIPKVHKNQQLRIQIKLSKHLEISLNYEDKPLVHNYGNVLEYSQSPPIIKPMKP